MNISGTLRLVCCIILIQLAISCTNTNSESGNKTSSEQTADTVIMVISEFDTIVKHEPNPPYNVIIEIVPLYDTVMMVIKGNDTIYISK